MPPPPFASPAYLTLTMQRLSTTFKLTDTLLCHFTILRVVETMLRAHSTLLDLPPRFYGVEGGWINPKLCQHLHWQSVETMLCTWFNTASSAARQIFTVWKEAGIEARTIATLALAVNRNNVMCLIQHCFICRPSDFTVWKEAVTESRTIAPFALAVNRNNVMCLIQHCFMCRPFLQCGRRLGLNPGQLQHLHWQSKALHLATSHPQ